MKTHYYTLAALLLGAGLLSTQAQFGPRGGVTGAMSGPQLSGSMAQLFGEHSAFSANLEIQVTDQSTGPDQRSGDRDVTKTTGSGNAGLAASDGAAGATLRDQMAMAALPMAWESEHAKPTHNGPSFIGVAERAYLMADAMMKIRDVTAQPNSETATVPGKLAYAEGKSRFEMEISQIKGNRMSPEMAAQMKQMGMDSMVMITRPDKKVSYMIYSGLQAYVENPLQSADTGKPASDFKVETTEVGKETVDGHPCVKNKVVVTDKDGKKLEATVWNATDPEMKKFPVKIETVESGNNVVMLYKEVKFAKPAASQFDPPSGFTKYENMQTMMQQIMMKRLGEGQGLPPQR